MLVISEVRGHRRGVMVTVECWRRL